jgi:hypothetical protein
MNVNTHNQKAFHDARISIPKTPPPRVLRDKKWSAFSTWDWFEVAPDEFYLAGSWDSANLQVGKVGPLSAQYIDQRYGVLRNVADLYPR